MGIADRAAPADLIPDAWLLQQTLRDLFANKGDKPAAYLSWMVQRTVRAHLADTSLSAAGAGFRARMDAAAWPRGVPWKRPVQPGRLDFWRINSFALDRLPELLAVLLPEGTRGITSGGAAAWIGWHPDRRETVAVCLLGGAWDEPGTGHGGRDLIELVAHMGGVGQGKAARWLAAFLQIEGQRHA